MTDEFEPKPAGLGRSGGELWDKITRDHLLEPHELRVLEDLARAADTVDALQAAIDADGVMIETVGGGARKVNPAVPEARQARLVVARLAASLRLQPADDDGDEDQGAEQRGQRRAGVRGVYVRQDQRA